MGLLMFNKIFKFFLWKWYYLVKPVRPGDPHVYQLVSITLDNVSISMLKFVLLQS